jgi:hypothetical protein
MLQPRALRLLDSSREVINATVTALWERLDEFGERQTRYAYKQVTALIGSPDPHGDRQWRCEAEQAGRILRGQAARKQQFALVLPLLEQGMIEPKTGHKRAGKSRTAIKAALAALREEHSNGGSAVELQSLIEQACNFYLKNGCFPDTYEDMQAIPVLKGGILPYAGDDGGAKGQAYRLRLDVEGGCCFLALRCPDERGAWPASWTEQQLRLPLPAPVVQRLEQGALLAPTLRETAEADGTRYAVLDFIIEVPMPELAESTQIQRVLGWDWGVRTLVTAVVLDIAGNRLSPPLFLDTGGFDGRQAHTRRHLDRLKAKVAKLEARRDRFPVGDRRREPAERQLVIWRTWLPTSCSCWPASGRPTSSLVNPSNRSSQKAEANPLVAAFVRWRNNSQIRGALWHTLRYKCHLAGVHLAWQHPAGTTHTCPHCGERASTYSSPVPDAPKLDAGAWLRCFACGWNGARDYAAAINIALLGVAFLKHSLRSYPSRRDDRPTMIQKGLNSESYIGSGLALRLPPTSPRGRLICSGKMFVNGWIKVVTLHSALPPEHMLRLCG